MDPIREPGEHIALSYILFLGRYICMSFHIHTLRILTSAYECLLCYVTYQSTPCYRVRTRAPQFQKRKVWLFRVHIMKAYVSGIAPPILNLGARLWCAVRFKLWPFYPGKIKLYINTFSFLCMHMLHVICKNNG